MTQYMSFAHVAFIRNATNNNEYPSRGRATIEVMTKEIRECNNETLTMRMAIMTFIRLKADGEIILYRCSSPHPNTKTTRNYLVDDNTTTYGTHKLKRPTRIVISTTRNVWL